MYFYAYNMSSSSRNTASQQNKSSSSSVKPKYCIEFGEGLKPVGDSATKLSTRAGEIIRCHIPVNFTDWRLVPHNFIDDVWEALLGEFEFPVDPVLCCPIIVPGFPSLNQRLKNDLRDMVRGVRKKRSKKRPALSEDGSVIPEEGAEVPEPPELTPELWESWRDKVPPGINRNVWHEFVDHEKKPETIAKNAANSKRRKQATVCHTLGRCSYTIKKYKLDDSGILQIPKDTTDKWLLGHQRRDGSVHPSATEPHKKVLEAKAKRQEAGTSGSKSTVVSEELEDVFGANRKDGVRGYSSSVSKKQAQVAAVAYSALQTRQSQNEWQFNSMLTDRVKLLDKYLIKWDVATRRRTACNDLPAEHKAPKCADDIRGLVCNDIRGRQENIPIPATNMVDDPSVAPTALASSTQASASVKFPAQPCLDATAKEFASILGNVPAQSLTVLNSHMQPKIRWQVKQFHFLHAHLNFHMFDMDMAWISNSEKTSQNVTTEGSGFHSLWT
ncbi:hypothetical protein C5167_018784 [Papaver somniferum]|uniref:Uncharacterized protein n=1 Tax=Papaver somniferum TaxID=3469 RepID=A0A4Y7IS97_PAPSO|nr:hypothetical protein C5167_018784 [Papaver somniferum]